MTNATFLRSKIRHAVALPMLLATMTASAQTAPSGEDGASTAAAAVEALGIPKTTGATTLKDNAGKLEGWMLVAGAINKAAEMIADSVATGEKSKGKSVLLIEGAGRLDFSQAVAVQIGLDAIGTGIENLRQESNPLTRGCPSLARPGASSESLESVTAIATLVGAVLSALRTDTEISGFSVDDANRALVNAVAARPGPAWIFPEEIAATTKGNPIVTAYNKLATEREWAIQCRVVVNAAATGDPEKKAAAPTLARLDGAISRADAYTAAITAPHDKAPSDLTAAIVASTLAEPPVGTLALRLSVESAGGSLLKRSNLFTTLGAPAVGITGGLIVSWRLFDPASGEVAGAGLIVCRTALTNLNAIQRGATGAPNCGWNTTTGERALPKKGE